MATARDETQLLNKHAVEKMTSLDITTIYRTMATGTFPPACEDQSSAHRVANLGHHAVALIPAPLPFPDHASTALDSSA
jgi:Prophage CP4-57 regulatory protein (AlpA)